MDLKYWIKNTSQRIRKELADSDFREEYAAAFRDILPNPVDGPLGEPTPVPGLGAGRRL